MVRNAAAAAIASGQPEKAVEWLEQGRSVIWGQLLNLRTPVDTLNERHPELAKQLLSLSAQLEKCGTRVNEQIPIDSGTQQSLQSIADQAHRNALARDQLLKRIRNLEGFDRFLLPKTISELSKAVQGGPVIILNVSDTGGDALALMPNLDGEVMHISLPNLTPEHAETLGRSLGTLVHHPGRNERLLGTREGQLQPEDEFANILSELWIGVVKPVLDGLAITVSDFIPVNTYHFRSNIPAVDSNQSQLSPYLVVSDRSSCFSPHSCCRALWRQGHLRLETI
jgi:hypothetical protein